MDNTQRLIELFKEFPGIGPRQAKRFVYFLLNKNEKFSTDLATLLKEVRGTVHACDTCFRFFPSSKSTTCSICRDENRNKKALMIVSHDVDFENIEKTKFFDGYYFILGGTVPILEKNPEKKIRQKELLNIIEKRIKNGLEEIIIAVSFNPEGENTLSYLIETLQPILNKNNTVPRSELGSTTGVKISTLGRGLSTGTELKYSDTETIKNALKNRQ